MGGSAGKGDIAQRLERLFATVTPLGRPYTLREAADGIRAREGRTVVSYQYLAQLRDGTRRQPSLDKLQAIARWFGVSVAYFTDDEVAERTDEDMRVFALMRDAGVRSVAFRAAGISAANLELVKGLLEQMRDAEGLPPADADGAGERPSPPKGA